MSLDRKQRLVEDDHGQEHECDDAARTDLGPVSEEDVEDDDNKRSSDDERRDKTAEDNVEQHGPVSGTEELEKERENMAEIPRDDPIGEMQSVTEKDEVGNEASDSAGNEERDETAEINHVPDDEQKVEQDENVGGEQQHRSVSSDHQLDDGDKEPVGDLLGDLEEDREKEDTVDEEQSDSKNEDVTAECSSDKEQSENVKERQPSTDDSRENNAESELCSPDQVRGQLIT